MAHLKFNDPTPNFDPASYFKQETRAQGALNQKGGGSNVNYNLPTFGNDNEFMNYKQPAAYMTQWSTVNQDAGMVALSANVPLDRIAQQNLMTNNGVNLTNNVLKNWTYSTQTLDNVGFNTNGVKQCTSNDSCAPLNDGNGLYTCNPNYQTWEDAVGQQTGSICSRTIYPELLWVDDNGNKGYNRKLQNEGGIGKSCVTNNDCGEGYECNNSTNTFGSNNQQTGYCAQTFMCPDGKKRFLGTPYNSLIPIVPPRDQNNGGKGYTTLEECQDNSSSSQHCVQHKGNFFAVYPGYCPIPSVLRQNGNPQGAFVSFKTSSEENTGFVIPPGVSNQLQHKYGFGSSKALGSLGSSTDTSSDNEPLAYIQSLNGVPKPVVKAQQSLFG